MASAAGLSRRKHMMSRQLTPRLGLAVAQRPGDAADDVGEGHASRHVALRVEEDLHVADAVGGDAAHVGGREVVEVLLRDEHGHARRSRCRGSCWRSLNRYWARHSSADEQGSVDAVAPPELEQQLRLERALDVQVQLRLGQPADEAPDGVAVAVGGAWDRWGRTRILLLAGG